MKNGLQLIDSDGHVFEHPTGMVPAMADCAPEKWRKRILENWGVTNILELTDADDEAARLSRPMLRPGGHQAKPRLEDMDDEAIDVSVLYPTMLLGVQSDPDAEFADAACSAYNDWLSDHVSGSDGRLWGAAVVPQQDIERAAREIRRAATLPGMKAAFIRPNPTEDWKPFNDEVYDPLWRAAADTGLALGLHPYLAPDLPGACQAFRLNRSTTTKDAIGSPDNSESMARTSTGNIFFTQAIANPVDMMNSLTYLVAGGVCERFPDLRLVFLEANGGWIVPWLERLDHHYEVFDWDVPWLKMKPSAYFRRQCWISFDTDESTLVHAANSPLVGADRIVWASDYPHPDAKIPGVADELVEAVADLSEEQQRLIAGESAIALYDL